MERRGERCVARVRVVGRSREVPDEGVEGEDGGRAAGRAGRDVRGVVAAEPVRRDARLAIRAAQDGVPVTAAASAAGARAAARAARALAGEWVSLVVGDSADVALGPASAAEIELALAEHAARVASVETAKRSLAADEPDAREETSRLLAGPFRRVAARDCAAPRAHASRTLRTTPILTE